jgi:hypothetical protein
MDDTEDFLRTGLFEPITRRLLVVTPADRQIRR